MPPDHMELSTRNGWYDDTGQVYIYYDLVEICRDTTYRRNKAMKPFPYLTMAMGLTKKICRIYFEWCYMGRDRNFGIGLAIAHSAAEKMEGHLESANQHESEAVFTVSLKIYYDAVKAPS